MSADARARNFARVAQERGAQQSDALDFLVYGDEDGRHAETCVHGEPCSRTYDPLPYAEAAPEPQEWYAGTGIGALYDLPGSERHAWQLAGWNLAPGSTR